MPFTPFNICYYDLEILGEKSSRVIEVMTIKQKLKSQLETSKKTTLSECN